MRGSCLDLQDNSREPAPLATREAPAAVRWTGASTKVLVPILRVLWRTPLGRKAPRKVPASRYTPGLQFVGFIIIAAAAATSSSTFGAETAIYWRECSANLNTPAYFLAKALGDVPMCACSAVAAYAGFLTKFSSPMANSNLLAGFLLLYVFGYLSGYLLSFAPARAQPLESPDCAEPEERPLQVETPGPRQSQHTVP